MNENFRLSVSKTKCFNQCKKQYEFNYILKLPKKDRDYHIFGKFCHQVLEIFHNYYIEGCLLPYNIAMADAFKATWAEFKNKMTPEMKKECWKIINQYLMLITRDKKNNTSFNIIACEKRFEVALNDKVVLNGAIDRIQLDPDGVLHVADYKTTQNKKYLKNDWQQLKTYGFILLNEDPNIKKIRGSYILMRHDFEYITEEFSAEELLKIKDQYIDYANQMMAEKDFEPNPTILCRYCDHVDSCIVGKKMLEPSKIYGEVNW